MPVENKRLSDGVKDLIKCILNPNPKTRYSISDIKEHKWFVTNLNKNEHSYFDYNIENEEDVMNLAIM